MSTVNIFIIVNSAFTINDWWLWQRDDELQLAQMLWMKELQVFPADAGQNGRRKWVTRSPLPFTSTTPRNSNLYPILSSSTFVTSSTWMGVVGGVT